MAATRHQASHATLVMLDAAAQAAGQVFACMFSTSDELEADLIAQRRAEGRYGRSRFWPLAMLVGGGLTLAGAAFLIF